MLSSSPQISSLNSESSWLQQYYSDIRYTGIPNTINTSKCRECSDIISRPQKENSTREDFESKLKEHLYIVHKIGDNGGYDSVPEWLHEHYTIDRKRYIGTCHYCPEKSPFLDPEIKQNKFNERYYIYGKIELERHLTRHQDPNILADLVGFDLMKHEYRGKCFLCQKKISYLRNWKSLQRHAEKCYLPLYVLGRREENKENVQPGPSTQAVCQQLPTDSHDQANDPNAKQQTQTNKEYYI